MPVVLELQNVAISRAICANPHVVIFIHVDAVFRLRPIESLAGTAPRLNQISLRIEFEDGWCAMPPTWPMIQLLGNSFGQDGSTLNFGGSGAAAVRPVEWRNKTIPIAQLTRRTTDVGRDSAMCMVFSNR
jgi:hypothetical protein